MKMRWHASGSGSRVVVMPVQSPLQPVEEEDIVDGFPVNTAPCNLQDGTYLRVRLMDEGMVTTGPAPTHGLPFKWVHGGLRV
jgi:hypothetical protein